MEHKDYNLNSKSIDETSNEGNPSEPKKSATLDRNISEFQESQCDTEHNTSVTNSSKIRDDFSKSKKIIQSLVFIGVLLLGIFIGSMTFYLFTQSKTQNSQLEPVIKEKTTEIVYRDNNDISDIVESAMDSIVSITSTNYYEQFNFFTGLQSYEVPSSGSGIIISKDKSCLYIATNNHVIQASTDLTIEFSDGSSAKASVNGSSSDSDIAVITVNIEDLSSETLNRIKIASLHNADDLKVGNQVIAIGNALGYGQSVTVGYISALNRTIQTENGEVSGLIQTDAAINPGNSGGALLNMNGEVIGINVAKYSSTEVEGIGYSIPVSKIQSLIDVLSKEKYSEEERGYLGIQCSTIDSNTAKMYDMPQGVFVYKISNETLVKEGLLEKDIITSIDNHLVSNVNTLTEFLHYYKNGSKVTLSIQRIENGEYVSKEIPVTLVSLETSKKME